MQMARDLYAAQVDLLVRTIPVVAKEPEFALKGGTAINLFYRNMPRLSVDIDLFYLPVSERAEALANIDAAFGRMVEGTKIIRGATARRVAGGSNGDTRMLVSTRTTEIKVEVSPVTRGTIFDPKPMRVNEAVEDAFGFAEMPVVSFEDLYAGKMVAALDRQHPRDLFDIHALYENEGITDTLFKVFLVYANFSKRPLNELLKPNLQDISQAFVQQFEGMTVEPVALDTLLATRAKLVEDIQARLTGNTAKFLVSMQSCEPDFDLIGLPQAAELPAIQWKLINLRKLRDNNPAKYEALQDSLRIIIKD